MKVIIVGGGKVGTRLASLLLTEGYQVRVIEVDPKQLPRLRQDLPIETVVAGNGQTRTRSKLPVFARRM